MNRRRLKNRSASAASFSSAGASSAYPAGTLKYSVGGTSFSAASVFGNSGGAGRPSSMWIVPPLNSARFRLWLPPNVWLHGSQSTSIGGSSARNGQIAWSIAWFEHSIRWVLMTPFGVAGRS